MISDKQIWVLYQDGLPGDRYSRQLAGKARALGRQLNTKIAAICTSDIQESVAEDLFRSGVSEIILAKSPQKDMFHISGIVGDLMEAYNPLLLMICATRLGRNVASILSARFDAGLTADCIDIDIDTMGELVFSRAALSDSVIARIKCQHSRFQICTVKPDAFILQEEDTSGHAIIMGHEKRSTLYCDISKIQVLERKVSQIVYRSDLHSSKVLFGVGRGIRDKGALGLLHKIAQKLNAEIVGTRAAVESGLIEKSRQVGQSGITVMPYLYVSLGISGASQHLVGVKNANLIIAVNSDKDAPIFHYADYCFVDDALEVLKSLESLIS